ncbi:MAG: hypothetical protein V1489_00995 [Candidatus Liptonbacteria bacterium]
MINLANISPQEFLDRYEALPKEILDLLASEDTQKSIGDICRAQGVSDENTIALVEQLTGFTAMGFMPFKDFANDFSEYTKISGDKSAIISDAIMAKILSPVATIIISAPAKTVVSDIKPAPLPVSMPAAKTTQPPTAPGPMLIHQEAEFVPINVPAGKLSSKDYFDALSRKPGAAPKMPPIPQAKVTVSPQNIPPAANVQPTAKEAGKTPGQKGGLDTARVVHYGALKTMLQSTITPATPKTNIPANEAKAGPVPLGSIGKSVSGNTTPNTMPLKPAAQVPPPPLPPKPPQPPQSQLPKPQSAPQNITRSPFPGVKGVPPPPPPPPPPPQSRPTQQPQQQSNSQV